MSQGETIARRALAVALVAAPLLAFGARARAETSREYVNRYVMLVDWVTRSEIWVSGHLEDLGLCRAAHAVAEEHVEIGRRMTPPQEYSGIHPHLLIVLENAERMYALAAASDRAGYRRHRRIVQDELRLIAEILQAEGRFMPEINP